MDYCVANCISINMCCDCDYLKMCGFIAFWISIPLLIVSRPFHLFKCLLMLPSPYTIGATQFIPGVYNTYCWSDFHCHIKGTEITDLRGKE